MILDQFTIWCKFELQWLFGHFNGEEFDTEEISSTHVVQCFVVVPVGFNKSKIVGEALLNRLFSKFKLAFN